MYKKIAFAAVGLSFLITPLALSAQSIPIPTVSPNASVAELRNIVQVLLQF